MLPTLFNVVNNTEQVVEPESRLQLGVTMLNNIVEPNTPSDNRVLIGLFGECHIYHFGVNSTDAVETQAARIKRRDHFGNKVNSTKLAKCEYSPERKQPTHPNWSEASIPEWQKYTMGV